MRLLDEVTRAKYEGRNDVGVEGIQVDLVSHMPTEQVLNGCAAMIEATWGTPNAYKHVSEERRIEALSNAVAGKELPNALENIPYVFAISGVTRAHTHQLVRTRVGAVFGQQSQRANILEDFDVRVPATFERADTDGFLMEKVRQHNESARRLYMELIEANVPPQDARFVVPEGTETHITAGYNLMALQGVMTKRLQILMQWEINWVARLMRDAVVKVHPWAASALRPAGERFGRRWNAEPMFYDATDEMEQAFRDGMTFEKVYQEFFDFQPNQGDTGHPYWFNCGANDAFLWSVWDAERIVLQEQNPGLVFPMSEPPSLENAFEVLSTPTAIGV